jgi:hypothetical protein
MHFIGDPSLEVYLRRFMCNSSPLVLLLGVNGGFLGKTEKNCEDFLM